MTKRFKFNDEHLEFVKENVVGRTERELLDMFNERFNTSLTRMQMQNFKRRHDLKSGVNGQYQKGHVPWSAGKKWTPEMRKKCERTVFKKGHQSHNALPVGSEKLNANGYIYIKINIGKRGDNWVTKHHYLYEKYKGKVPENHVVIFADGNNRNFDLDNLVLVTKQELLYLNKHKLIYNDCELTKTGVLIARLMTTVNKKVKK